MKQILLSLLILLLACQVVNAQEPSTPEIEWLSMEEALRRNEENPRKFLIDIYTDWCGWCKKLDQTTFRDPNLVELVNRHFYAVKLDGEFQGDILFQGKNYSFVKTGNRGYHALASMLMQGRNSYPTVAFLDETGKPIGPIPGYRDAKEMQKVITYFAGEFYTFMDLPNFLKSYQLEE
ncbi:DUF255 domain-containing protein [Pontibacter sp. G13]|uniref:thioredoxin family protein n=1 Tax=Pontibacter sp. G13 TaxID=3074898 RepID=UPI00288990F6|nr:DUF255 domain-containing protein [Pontibacter sp. G13]WNJ19579.1 DUF255 domain-containing protein [Pontibacter sp. G13]